MPKRDQESADDELLELAITGDVGDNESELTEKLLGIPFGGECVIYFDSPGGSPYTAISLSTIIRLRGIRATGIVTGECSSAALWPFAACQTRLVTPYSILLFHSMKWQSEEHVEIKEAREWARHFDYIEQEMDQLLAELFQVPWKKLSRWNNAGRYVTGTELAKAGLAELIPITPLVSPKKDKPKRKRSPKQKAQAKSTKTKSKKSKTGESKKAAGK